MNDPFENSPFKEYHAKHEAWSGMMKEAMKKYESKVTDPFTRIQNLPAYCCFNGYECKDLTGWIGTDVSYLTLSMLFGEVGALYSLYEADNDFCGFDSYMMILLEIRRRADAFSVSCKDYFDMVLKHADTEEARREISQAHKNISLMLEGHLNDRLLYEYGGFCYDCDPETMTLYDMINVCFSMQYGFSGGEIMHTDMDTLNDLADKSRNLFRWLFIIPAEAYCAAQN